MNKNKGITIITLVITITVLIILSGITISALTGDNGIISRAQSAKEDVETTQSKVVNQIEDIKNQIINKGNAGSDNSEEDNLNSEFNENDGVNKPKLTDGMLPVKYDTSKGKWVITNVNDEEWYNYKTEKKWANVMLSDGKYKTSAPGEYTTDGQTTVEIDELGSMFVWIPRYCYKINGGYHSNTKGTIDVKFLIGKTNQTSDNATIAEYNSETTSNYSKFLDGYVVHPTFSSNVNNGGWNKELEGIWVAKFEAGYPMEGKTYDKTLKNSDNLYYPVFKGQRYSYNNILVGEVYTLSRNMCGADNPYEITILSNSHMMKNSEWGAVAYLSESQYGKGSKIYINNVGYSGSINNIAGTKVYALTGYSANAVSAATVNATGLTIGDTIRTSSAWYTSNGYNASTTGNIYGIYDMSGGNWEYQAATIQTGNEGLENGSSFAKITESTKYTTLYPVGNSTKELTNISSSYASFGSMFGDAIWETSSQTGTNYSWNSEATDEDIINEVFFIRGGSYGDKELTGVFNFHDATGEAHTICAFRTVLTVE